MMMTWLVAGSSFLDAQELDVFFSILFQDFGSSRTVCLNSTAEQVERLNLFLDVIEQIFLHRFAFRHRFALE